MSAAPPAFTNRLAGEQSPYLRQHAHNPVDWYPWGGEAFARARAEDKPIFLSVGYSTCHWCHVMAHESFEEPAIAERLNRDFVPVKVDREERPDVDRVYMTYVQAATGQGGWPMSVWLTPDLKPFYGGTYFPPEDRGGRPGLGTILDALSRAWATNRDAIEEEAERVVGALRQLAVGQSSKSQAPNPKETPSEPNPTSQDPDLQESIPTQNPKPQTQNLAAAAAAAAGWCLQQLTAGFDGRHGGFGGAPKFPRAAVFNFLMRVPAETGGDAAEMAALTLRRMAAGGLHDHVGGGFHRYSVDDEWFVPHFEKMLYDQAQLALCYLEARQATGDERYAWVARDTLGYVLRDLANPAGGFYSAEDADSTRSVEGRPTSVEREAPGTEGNETKDEGQAVEGAFYVWTKREIEEALRDGAATPPSPDLAGINPAPPLPVRPGSAPPATTIDSGAATPASPGPENATRASRPHEAVAAARLRQGDGVERASHPEDDVALFCAHFDVQEGGNVAAERDPHGEFRGRNILRQRQPLAETARRFGLDPEAVSDRLQAGLVRLQAVRARRPRPALDDKIITAWNGLMISALAKAHQVLDPPDRSVGRAGPLGPPDQSVGASVVAEATPGAVHEADGPAARRTAGPAVPPYLTGAIRAAEFLRRELFDEPTGTLYRSFRSSRSDIPGFAEDYAYLIQGLLDLYEASFEIRWLRWAETLQAKMDGLFWDADGGGYFSSRIDAPGIIARMKEVYDGAEPAPASVAVANLLRLDAMIGGSGGAGAAGTDYRSRALRCAESLRAQWEQAPLALPQLLAALDVARRPPRTVVLAGNPAADDFQALAAAVHGRLRPGWALLAADGGEAQRWLVERRPEIGDMRPLDGRAAAYVCADFTCQAPVASADDLRRLLA